MNVQESALNYVWEIFEVSLLIIIVQKNGTMIRIYPIPVVPARGQADVVQV